MTALDELEVKLEPEDEECLRRLEAMTDKDIDFSDIPEVTDWTGWVRARDGRPVVSRRRAKAG